MCGRKILFSTFPTEMRQFVVRFLFKAPAVLILCFLVVYTS